MAEDIASLTRIGSLLVPDNPGGFYPPTFIRSGTPGIKDVGSALAEYIEEYSLRDVLGGMVAFYRSADAETAEIPEALRARTSPLNWWQIYCFLQWPSGDLYKSLRYKDQIACLVESAGNRPRAVRAKLGWVDGHSIGLRPTDQPDWKWNEGTIFAVQEP